MRLPIPEFSVRATGGGGFAGVTDRDDISYIYSTFPIVEKQERRAWGSYRSLDLCLAWMNALDAGKPDAGIAA